VGGYYYSHYYDKSYKATCVWTDREGLEAESGAELAAPVAIILAWVDPCTLSRSTSTHR
jgi:hypothetical protein